MECSVGRLERGLVQVGGSSGSEGKGIGEGREDGGREWGRGEVRYLSDMRIEDLLRDAHFDGFHHLAG